MRQVDDQDWPVPPGRREGVRSGHPSKVGDPKQHTEQTEVGLEERSARSIPYHPSSAVRRRKGRGTSWEEGSRSSSIWYYMREAICSRGPGYHEPIMADRSALDRSFIEHATKLETSTDRRIWLMACSLLNPGPD